MAAWYIPGGAGGLVDWQRLRQPKTPNALQIALEPLERVLTPDQRGVLERGERRQGIEALGPPKTPGSLDISIDNFQLSLSRSVARIVRWLLSG